MVCVLGWPVRDSARKTTIVAENFLGRCKWHKHNRRWSEEVTKEELRLFKKYNLLMSYKVALKKEAKYTTDASWT